MLVTHIVHVSIVNCFDANFYLNPMRPITGGAVEYPQGIHGMFGVRGGIWDQVAGLAKPPAEVVHFCVHEHWGEVLDGDAMLGVLVAERPGEVLDVHLQFEALRSKCAQILSEKFQDVLVGVYLRSFTVLF